jgi:hypothetical protein
MSARTRFRFVVLLLAASLPLAAAAQAAKPVACPYPPAALAKVLGGSFKPGTEEPGLMGTACRYVGDKFNVGVLQTVLAGTIAPDDTDDYRVPMSAIAPAEQALYRDLVQQLAVAAGVARVDVTDAMVARAAALQSRGFLTPNLTPEAARALWAQVNR